jgi:arylsulfatase A-like enzyme
MEGVRAHEVGAYGGSVPGVTPNLDALAVAGTRFDGVWSPGTHTPEGELALWYGLLAVPREIVMTLHPRVSMTGLPEILRRAGWRSFLWIHNSDQTFFGEDRFFLPRGFRMIDGRDFDPAEPRTNWGFSDRTLARRAAVAIDRMEEPFAAMVLTISNHHPFQLPSDAKTQLDVPAAEERGSFHVPGWRDLVGGRTVPMLRTIHYTDEAVGDFFDRVRARPWFSRTVFVIVSDHGLPIAPLGGISSLHRFAELRHGVPWILYSPLLPARPAVPGPSSLADVPPTLLGLLGVDLPASGVGCDRLDPAACDPERPVFSWNDEGEMLTIATVSRVFHAVIAWERVSGGEGGSLGEEMLYDAGADPEGRRDLSLSEPARVREFRKLARLYLGVYPWLVNHGHSGVPDAAFFEAGQPSRPGP